MMEETVLSLPDFDEPEGVRVDAAKVRGRIRALISQFMERPRPLPPSDADLLNEFLASSRPAFASVIAEMGELRARLAKAKPGVVAAIERSMNDARARRSEIVASAAVSEEFLTRRSEAKARYNEALGAFEDEEETISALKPFLGMPHLPAIEAYELSAKAILAELTRTSPLSPRKGQMVLQEPEDTHLKPQFTARSALASGLDEKLIGKRKMVAIPFHHASSEAAEAGGLGAVEKSRKSYFLIDSRRPIGMGTWANLDDYLPYAFRSLSVPLLPVIDPSCTRFGFEEAFGKATWGHIEAEEKDKSGNVCRVCGSHQKLNVRARWQFREPVEGSLAPGVAKLEEFIVLCAGCTDALRPALSSVAAKSEQGYVQTSNKAREDWLALINRWWEPECAGYARQAYLIAFTAHQRRSRFNWIVDLSKQRSLFFGLEPGFAFGENGWIDTPDGPTFKVVGTPVFDRERIRHYFPVPDIFELKWGSTLRTAMAEMQDFDFGVIDHDGGGHRQKLAERVDELSPEMKSGIAELEDSEVEDLDVSAKDRISLEKTGGDTGDASAVSLDQDEDDLGYDPNDPKYAGMTKEEVYASFDEDVDCADPDDYTTKFVGNVVLKASQASARAGAGQEDAGDDEEDDDEEVGADDEETDETGFY